MGMVSQEILWANKNQIEGVEKIEEIKQNRLKAKDRVR
jgi:hypothetical protein